METEHKRRCRKSKKWDTDHNTRWNILMDIIIVQEQEEVGSAPPYRSDSVKDVKVKNIEEVQQSPHEEEKERKLDTDRT